MNRATFSGRNDDPDILQVLEAIPDAVVVIDTDFTVRLVNAGFTALTGVPRTQAIGKKCYEVFSGDMCRTSACPMNRIDKGVEQLRYEGDKHCACGRSAPGIITASAYRTPSGELSGVIEIVSDMTPLYESRERFRKAMGGVIQAMSLTIEKRDPYTAGHQRRVTKLCRAIAGELGFSWDRTQGLRMAAAIHDLGKVLVPAAILNKTGELSEQEMAIIREHPRTAYEILKNIDFPWPLAQTIYQHHERMDGSGYPQGLKGEAILLEARILAVADVVDAICCFRPYRPAAGPEAALAELSALRETCYDAAVVDACTKVLTEGKVNLGACRNKNPIG
ncbi:MAG: HD domain-containing protein [Deltaproteobacteria bacterium]|nr:HD domain-containing protein [Deltaproteobacteria bacterium]MBW2152264.1 HD domain-containing protein [Deltaproteobacteria bacterium]